MIRERAPLRAGTSVTHVQQNSRHNRRLATIDNSLCSIVVRNNRSQYHQLLLGVRLVSARSITMANASFLLIFLFAFPIFVISQNNPSLVPTGYHLAISVPVPATSSDNFNGEFSFNILLVTLYYLSKL